MENKGLYIENCQSRVKTEEDKYDQIDRKNEYIKR